MVLPRTSAFGSTWRSTISRTSRLRARTPWRTTGRRTYADHGHGAQKASSDLPWLIGSVVVTVPSAAWLWQQGPKKGDHGHEGHGEHEEHEEKHEDGEEESKDEGSEEGKDEGADKEENTKESHEGQGDDGEGEGKPGSPQASETASDEAAAPPGEVRKGKGEKQKGETRPRTETKGEKDAHKDESGAKNPYLDDPEKSKKGEGVKDTAKIHGTVDPQRNVRGPGDGEQPKHEGGVIPKDTDQGKTRDSQEGKGQHKGNTEEGV